MSFRRRPVDQVESQDYAYTPAPGELQQKSDFEEDPEEDEDEVEPLPLDWPEVQQQVGEQMLQDPPEGFVMCCEIISVLLRCVIFYYDCNLLSYVCTIGFADGFITWLMAKLLMVFGTFFAFVLVLSLGFTFLQLSPLSKLIAMIKRRLPWRRQATWDATQTPERVELLRTQYDQNKNLVEQTECPICWEARQHSRILFPCLHHICVDCGKLPDFQNSDSQCPVCRTVIDDYVDVEGKPFQAQFRVGREMKDWVINWCSGDNVAAGN